MPCNTLTLLSKLAFLFSARISWCYRFLASIYCSLKFLCDESSQVINTQLCLCFNVIDDLKDRLLSHFNPCALKLGRIIFFVYQTTLEAASLPKAPYMNACYKCIHTWMNAIRKLTLLCNIIFTFIPVCIKIHFWSISNVNFLHLNIRSGVCDASPEH